MAAKSKSKKLLALAVASLALIVLGTGAWTIWQGTSQAAEQRCKSVAQRVLKECKQLSYTGLGELGCHSNYYEAAKFCELSDEERTKLASDAAYDKMRADERAERESQRYAAGQAARDELHRKQIADRAALIADLERDSEAQRRRLEEMQAGNF